MRYVLIVSTVILLFLLSTYDTSAQTTPSLAPLQQVLSKNPQPAPYLTNLWITPEDQFPIPGFWYGWARVTPDGRGIVWLITKRDGTWKSPDIIETFCHELTHLLLQKLFNDPGHNTRHDIEIAACVKRSRA